MAARKKWATALDGNKLRRRSSERSVYRMLKEQAGQVERLPSPMMTIWVDEGDGRGWQTFERIDLRQVRR